MSTYIEMFNLILKDVNLIDRAVHQQIDHLSVLEAPTHHKKQHASDIHKKLLS
jgi:hypothetical protein